MGPDVLVVGGGPVGLTAALLLARHGLSVEVLERRSSPSAEPRAVSLDDEALRIWQSCGLDDLLGEDWAGGTEGQCICSYFDRRDRVFLQIHQRTSDLGHPHAVLIHEGRIEEKLIHAASRHPCIRLNLGAEVSRIRQQDGAVLVSGCDAHGAPFERRAAWLLGCDGARSRVREELGIAMPGEELPHPWLVANLEDGGEPGHVRIRCRAGEAAVTLPLPHGLRRVEVELDTGDDGRWLGDEGAVRRHLSRGWEGALRATIVAAGLRRFRAAIAARWREGRAFLAGDAAHLMPPFAGQGLGAGLRDVANLAFKIAGVRQGWLSPEVLDSYERERRPHLERMIRLARRLGAVMSPAGPRRGDALHAGLRLAGGAGLLRGRWRLRGPNIRPTLREGFLVPGGQAGRYLPQPTVLAPDGRRLPLDALLGPRMTWLILGGRGASAPRLRDPMLQPSDTVLMEGREFHDPDMALRRRYGAGSLVLVRPDRIVHTHVRPRSPILAPFRRLACDSMICAWRDMSRLASPGPSCCP